MKILFLLGVTVLPWIQTVRGQTASSSYSEFSVTTSLTPEQIHSLEPFVQQALRIPESEAGTGAPPEVWRTETTYDNADLNAVCVRAARDALQTETEGTTVVVVRNELSSAADFSK